MPGQFHSLSTAAAWPPRVQFAFVHSGHVGEIEEKVMGRFPACEMIALGLSGLIFVTSTMNLGDDSAVYRDRPVHLRDHQAFSRENHRVLQDIESGMSLEEAVHRIERNALERFPAFLERVGAPWTSPEAAQLSRFERIARWLILLVEVRARFDSSYIDQSARLLQELENRR